MCPFLPYLCSAGNQRWSRAALRCRGDSGALPRAFRLSFDQRPEPERRGKRIFLIHDPDKLSAIREIYGIDPAVSLAHHINFAVLEGGSLQNGLPAGGLPDSRLRKRPGEGIPSGAGDLSL